MYIDVYTRTNDQTHNRSVSLKSQAYQYEPKKEEGRSDKLSTATHKDAGNDDLRRTVRQNMITWEIKTVNLSIFQGYPAPITPSQKCLVDRDKLDIKLESGAMIGLAILLFGEFLDEYNHFLGIPGIFWLP